MPRDCGNCDGQIEPVALPYDTDDKSGWFLVCPVCHYFFDKLDPTWFSQHPRAAAREREVETERNKHRSNQWPNEDTDTDTDENENNDDEPPSA